jgi:hypothetical protein
MRAKNTLAIWLLLSILFTWIEWAHADWMNLSGAETAPNIAEITVLDDRVRIALEFSISDLATFRDLLPDKWLENSVSNRASPSERLARFSSEVIQIIANDEINLRAELKLIEPRMRKKRVSPYAGSINPMTRRPVPQAPQDKRVFYTELEYRFDGNPESLTFIPPLDAEGVSKANIGFITYHKTVPVIDFRYLSSAARLTLNWKDPWYTQFDNRNLKRHHKSVLMGFLYVEPREIRQEAIMSVQDLREWTDLGFANIDTASRDVQDAIKDQAITFFSSRNPLSVDGQNRNPASIRAEFLNLSPTGVRIIEDAKAIDLTSAVIGVILSYPTKQLPQHVALTWDLFNKRTERIPTITIDPAGPLAGTIDRVDPVIEWRNFLRTYEEPEVLPVVIDGGQTISVPLASLVIFIFTITVSGFVLWRGRQNRLSVGLLFVTGIGIAVLTSRMGSVEFRNPFAGPPDNITATIIVESVLTNVNHAFLSKDKNAQDNSLAIVIVKDRIPEVAPELRRARAIKVAGGGIAWVKSIEELKVTDIIQQADTFGFRAIIDWTALASGSHFGHVHNRKIRFRALMELAPINKLWKLTGLTVLEARPES